MQLLTTVLLIMLQMPLQHCASCCCPSQSVPLCSSSMSLWLNQGAGNGRKLQFIVHNSHQSENFRWARQASNPFVSSLFYSLTDEEQGDKGEDYHGKWS